MHAKSKSLKASKEGCTKSSTLKSTINDVSGKTKGIVSKQVKLELSLIKIEEFLQQPKISYKSSSQGVTEKNTSSVKLHKSTKTTFIKPFNTLKLEDPLIYTTETNQVKLEKVATPNMKTIFAKTHKATTNTFNSNRSQVSLKLGRVIEEPNKYIVTPKNVLKRARGSKVSQGRSGIATLAQKYKPTSS